MILCDFVVYPVFWFQIVKLLLVFCLILASCTVSFFHHVKRRIIMLGDLFLSVYIPFTVLKN